ncbi:hypothetical protein QQW46_001191 [Escherichia coli]|nr:hypothetical protein [Escherichia coli]
MSTIENRKKTLPLHDESYKKKLSSLDPNRIGLVINCPKCNTLSWLKLPENQMGWDDQIILACPSACGYGGLIDTFKPTATKRVNAGDFDIDTICRKYKTPYAFNGYVNRCPVCYIENPREILMSFVEKAEIAHIKNHPREKLIQLTNDIVSAFDGVMKRCFQIHMSNGQITGYKTPSFQNIIAVNDDITHLIKLDKVVDDWRMFIKIFQKRHLFVHSLGVVDQKYIDKTGDASVTIGKQVPLNSQEVLFLAQNTSKIVMTFFGQHLS